MKKKMFATLPILLCTATVLPFAANVVEVEASARTDELIAPQTYEEYLPLTAPTDVAVSENYTAIADGNFIYIYDRQDGEYRKYTHGEESVPENTVTKLQFDEYGTLYFLDSSVSTNFYTLNVETGSEKKIDLACGTFTVHGSDLYFTNAQKQLYYASLVDSTVSQTISLKWDKVSSLSFWNGELYFIFADYYLMKIDPKLSSEPNASKDTFAMFSSQINHISIGNGLLACTSAAGELITYALSQVNDSDKLFQSEKEGFSGVCAFGNYVYSIASNDATILQYSIETNAFTDFEISASSDSLHRFRGATETCLAGNKLFIADNGNERVSVYNRETESFETPINATLPPSFLSSDEKTLLLANAEKAVLYSLEEETYGEQIGQFSAFNGKLVGTASVYGTYYLISENNYAYALAPDAESGVWTLTETKKTSTHSPKALTADVYGNLYILSGSDVYSFNETQFTSSGEAGEKVFQNLPTATTKLAVDYNGAIYALAGGAIYREDGAVFSFDDPLVYYEDKNATPVLNSFAFGVEENETYVLCEGNYLIKSTALSLPTVKTIKVNGADESVFANAAAEFTVVKTSENALLVEFELQTLGGAEYFPYLSLERRETQRTALKIGETERYYLLAEYNQKAGAYKTYLALRSSCTPLEADDYRTEYGVEEQKTGYITSAITLYKFPYLTELLKSGELERGAMVTVLGEIKELDHAYFHVAFESENGEIKTGYIPQAFVNDFSGLPPASETIEKGETESDLDSVGRLAYLLLGFAAICILTDYLLLRKKKGGDDYE